MRRPQLAGQTAGLPGLDGLAGRNSGGPDITKQQAGAAGFPGPQQGGPGFRNPQQGGPGFRVPQPGGPGVRGPQPGGPGSRGPQLGGPGVRGPQLGGPGFGGPQDVPAGFGGPQGVPPGFGGPQGVPPGFGGPQGVPPGFGGPQRGKLGRGGPPRGGLRGSAPQGGRPVQALGASDFDSQLRGPPQAGFGQLPIGPGGPGPIQRGGPQAFGPAGPGLQNLDQLRLQQRNFAQQQQGGGRPGGGLPGRDQQGLQRTRSKSKVNQQKAGGGTPQPGDGAAGAKTQQAQQGAGNRQNLGAAQQGFRPIAGPGPQAGDFGGPGGRDQLVGRLGPELGFGPQDPFGPGGPRGGPGGPFGGPFGGPQGGPLDGFAGPGRVGRGPFPGGVPPGFGGPGGLGVPPGAIGGPQGGRLQADIGLAGIPSDFGGPGPRQLRKRGQRGSAAGFRGGANSDPGQLQERPPRASTSSQASTPSENAERTANGIQYVDSTQLRQRQRQRQTQEPLQRRPQRFQSPQGPQREVALGGQGGRGRQQTLAGGAPSNFPGGGGNPFPVTELNPELRFTAEPPRF